MGNEEDPKGDDVVEEKFRQEQNRSLSDAVLSAIDHYKEEDLTKSDFVLYDDIDPDALNNLFRHEAQPQTTLYFTTNDVWVELWGDSGVEIRVRDKQDGIE